MVEVPVSANLHKDKVLTGYERYGVIGRSGFDVLYNTKYSLSAAPIPLNPVARLWLACIFRVSLNQPTIGTLPNRRPLILGVK